MTLALILLNVAAFFAEMAAPEPALVHFALWPWRAGAAAGEPAFHAWQLVTYSALHANLAHVGFNMLGLYIFGRDVELALGCARLLLMYLTSVVSGALVQLAIAHFVPGDAYPTIGASAGVFGVLAGYAMLYPKRRVVLLFPPVPMPAWLFALGYAGVELALGVSGAASGIAHFAHLGGMLGAFAWMRRWPRAPHVDDID